MTSPTSPPLTPPPLFSSALLVEDEPNLAIALQTALNKLGIPNRYAPTLAIAKACIQEELPEFILLDRTLPDGDGIHLCTWIRHNHFQGTILILTASGQIEDRVQGLDCGADDYLSKPFSWEELEARIKALARRKPLFHGHRSLDPSQLWHIDASKLQILGPKGLRTLTPLEFKLARQMIHQSGNIVSRDALLKKVWGFTFLPKTRTVDYFFSRLRKHFEDNPEEPKHFLTIRGAGYQFQP